MTGQCNQLNDGARLLCTRSIALAVRLATVFLGSGFVNKIVPLPSVLYTFLSLSLYVSPYPRRRSPLPR